MPPSLQLFVDWEAPLALGPKAFAYLLRTFEDTHHSIDATVSALQVGLSSFCPSPSFR